MAQDISALLSRYRCKGATSRSREHDLQKRYGIDQATYERLAQSQGNVCAICHGPQVTKDVHDQLEPLDVDHDHATGRVRGLLCRNCNTALGKLGDDPNRLRAAAAYLDHGGTAGAAHQPRRGR